MYNQMKKAQQEKRSQELRAKLIKEEAENTFNNNLFGKLKRLPAFGEPGSEGDDYILKTLGDTTTIGEIIFLNKITGEKISYVTWCPIAADNQLHEQSPINEKPEKSEDSIKIFGPKEEIKLQMPYILRPIDLEPIKKPRYSILEYHWQLKMKIDSQPKHESFQQANDLAPKYRENWTPERIICKQEEEPLRKITPKRKLSNDSSMSIISFVPLTREQLCEDMEISDSDDDGIDIPNIPYLVNIEIDQSNPKESTHSNSGTSSESGFELSPKSEPSISNAKPTLRCSIDLSRLSRIPNKTKDTSIRCSIDLSCLTKIPTKVKDSSIRCRIGLSRLSGIRHKLKKKPIDKS